MNVKGLAWRGVGGWSGEVVDVVHSFQSKHPASMRFVQRHRFPHGRDVEFYCLFQCIRDRVDDPTGSLHSTAEYTKTGLEVSVGKRGRRTEDYRCVNLTHSIVPTRRHNENKMVS